MSELGLVFLLVQSVLGVVLAIRHVQLKKKYYFLEVDYMIARDNLAPFQKILKKMDTKEYRLKAGFEELKLMKFHQALTEYYSYIRTQIGLAQKKNDKNELERLKVIQKDIVTCYGELINGKDGRSL